MTRPVISADVVTCPHCGHRNRVPADLAGRIKLVKVNWVEAAIGS